MGRGAGHCGGMGSWLGGWRGRGRRLLRYAYFCFGEGMGENGEKGGRYDGTWRASGAFFCFHEKARDGLNSSGPRKATGTSPGK